MGRDHSSTPRSKPTSAIAAAFLVVTGRKLADARRHHLRAPGNVGPFDPIRHSHRAQLAALAAPHPRAEREHREVVGPGVDGDIVLRARQVPLRPIDYIPPPEPPPPEPPPIPTE
jgi:hypothetical protein